MFMVPLVGLVTSQSEDVPLRRLVAVPSRRGQDGGSVMACDFTGRGRLPAKEFSLTLVGVRAMLRRVGAVLPPMWR